MKSVISMLLIGGDDKKKLRDEFNRVDINKDGFLTYDEIKKAYGKYLK